MIVSDDLVRCGTLFTGARLLAARTSASSYSVCYRLARGAIKCSD